jgi:hypothetical protein
MLWLDLVILIFLLKCNLRVNYSSFCNSYLQIGSQNVPQVPHGFPNMFPITPNFVPYSLPKPLPLGTLEPIEIGKYNWDLDVFRFGVNTFYS